MKYLTLFAIALISLNLQAGLRARIKARFIKKQEEKPAPLLSKSLLSFKHNGVDRYYVIHVPPTYNPAKEVPLFVALHGGGGNMKIQATDEYYKLISKSDKEGFIIVFPNGFSQFRSGNFATWNAGHCCGDARDKKSDDVGFIKELIKKVSGDYKIDSKRIFSIGMSNGGMMAYRLACEMPDVLKGIASVAGTDNTISCFPPSPISILHIHAKDDDHVLFNGGSGKGLPNKSKVTEFTSVQATIQKWVKLNHCHPRPIRILEKHGVYCDRYSKCRGDVKVQLCVTESGGHSWPGGKKPRGVKSNFQAISANDLIYDYFLH